MKKRPLGALSQLLIVTGDEGYSSQVGFCWLFVDERTEIRWPWRLTREWGGIDSVTNAARDNGIASHHGFAAEHARIRVNGHVVLDGGMALHACGLLLAWKARRG